ncbi:tRNA glutamyl-Q(34) synthetase GluQRS [Trueperella bernardiae]|uniref:tRNA glutamyl-Q(34) synthetase GluQRS n=1 Tax=Trueperella bernardiae TaxID=59561 RepID=UPI0029492865|nr:tRNA glutamyl-Q(34) synthetase GluQRS [Trueperella bernardiae]MDV6239868.1 tRNA glutamyl-Q(34) synthetase GluQRS [Trueperella bernardiae]
MTGRYAPSPTGDLHLGNLRTALLAWAFARREGLGFHMRMEDLDDRSRPQYYDRQLADLDAIGVDWDGDVLHQSTRIDRYEQIFAELIARGLLYECYCTRRELADVASAPHRPPGCYAGTCRDLTEAEREEGRAKLAGMYRGPAYRLRAEVDELEVIDRLAGRYTGAVDDFVIRRGDGAYSYNFVSVVDDGDFGVTQIVRADDLLPSTPRQVYLQRLLGYETPEYIHVPLVLNLDGVRLAKRDGAVTLTDLAAFGWDPRSVRALLLESLGLPADADLADIAPEVIPREPWLLDVAALELGPRA